MDKNISEMLNCFMDSNLRIKESSEIDVPKRTGDTGFDGDVCSYAVGGFPVPSGTVPMTGWNWWQDYYYPNVIREVYPVYVQERTIDSGKKAYEIIKALNDKKIIKLDKVSDFVEAMDLLIKML